MTDKPAKEPGEASTTERLSALAGKRTWRDWLAVCRMLGALPPHPWGLIIAGLEADIGLPPPGSHPDEAKPRGETWHAERANWQAEVERLRAAASDPLAPPAPPVSAGLAQDASGRIWTGTPPGFEHPNNLVHKARCATLFGGEARFACDLKEGHAGPHEEYPKPAPPVAVGPNRCRENPGCTQHHGHGGDCTWPPAPAPASLRDKAIDAIIDYFATWDVEPAILAARAAVAARKEGKP